MVSNILPHLQYMADVTDWYFRCLPSSSAPSQPSGSGSGSAVPTLVGNENFMADGTYLRATRLGDGSILSVHTSFSNGVNIIATQSSHDDGVTWQDLGEA